MSKVTEVEVRFNAKSSAQTISEALALATKHGADTREKMCAVQFADATDPDLQKLLNLVSGLKGSKVLVNGQEYKPKDVLATLYCPDRPVCKSACKHLRMGFQRLEEFLLYNKPYIKGTTLTTPQSHLITQFSNFIEAQKENEYLVKKELLQDYLAEQTKFEAEFCEKYQKAKLEEIVEQFPKKIVLNPMEMGVGISFHHAAPTPPRQRKAPARPEFARYIDTYYKAQIQGQVLQHYLATLLHQVFPDKLDVPAAIAPDELLLGLGIIPEAQKGQFYAQLADTAPPPQAREYWKKAVEVERDPNVLAELFLDRGNTLAEEGKIDEAVQLLKEGNAKCPDDFLILEALAGIEVERKDLKAALDYLQRALELGDEWNAIQENSAFIPLQELPEFQILKNKYGGA